MYTFSELQNKFLYGGCSTFAMVLSSIYDLPIIDLYDADDTYIHSMVCDNTKSDSYFDAAGVGSILSIKHRYALSDYFIYDSSLETLKSFYQAELVIPAMYLIKNLISRNKLPMLYGH